MPLVKTVRSSASRCRATNSVRGAGIQDHDRTVAHQFGRAPTDGVLLGGELQVPLVDRLLCRAGQCHTAIGSGDVAVLMSSDSDPASDRGEGDSETFGDLLHAERTGLDCLKELEDLLAAPCPADVAAPGDEFVVGAARGCGVRSLLVAAHSHRSYMRDMRKSSLNERINHIKRV